MTAFHKTIRNSLPLAGMVLVIIYCLLGLSLFHKVLSTLISQLDNSDYTYCYFIPVIIPYLIYEKRKLIKQLNITHPWF